ncbi:MAG TPA: paraquat-inducible protein A [Puia sp.]|nr:paraquat-inducible protein A [Puia sp.]
MPNRTFITGCLLIVLVICGFCGYKIHTLSEKQEKVKRDYSIINNVSFGLLSVSNWRDQVEVIIGKRIENFNLTASQKQELKTEIEELLHTLISEAVRKINKTPKTFGGKLKKLAFKTIVDTNSIHAQVPAFAQKIIDQVTKPSSKEKIKDIAQSKLEQLSQQTYDSSANDMKHTLDSVFQFYAVNEKNSFDKKTDDMLVSLRQLTYNYAYVMLGMVVLMLGAWFWLRKDKAMAKIVFVFSLATASILLLVGVTTTMIELDARLKSLSFQIVGSPVRFDNEVLFFQSKSILSVVRILISTGKVDMVIVGFLILCFSVFFPIGKLLSSAILVLGPGKLAGNRVMQFFAFKSSKWSMADVMVVAIMMTYIGLNGVLQSQMASLNMQTSTITSITTNNTALQPGYIIFVGFVVYGLFLSEAIKRLVTPKETRRNNSTSKKRRETHPHIQP